MEVIYEDTQVTDVINTMSENVSKVMERELGLTKYEDEDVEKNKSTCWESCLSKLKSTQCIVFTSLSLLLLLFLVTVSYYRYHEVVMVCIIVIIVTQCLVAIWYTIYSSYKDKQRGDSTEDLSLR